MNKKNSSFLIVLCTFLYLYCCQLAFGQVPSKIYANTLQSTHDQGVWARAIITDAIGNTYATGLYHGTCDFDPSAGENKLVYQGGTIDDTDGESDVYLAKYDPSGTLLWARNLIEPTFGGMNEERPTAITIDQSNNLYLSGFTNTRGFFISKWDENGNEIWSRYFDDTAANNVLTFGIKPIIDGIVVSGLFIATVDFDPAPTTTSALTATSSDGFLLALNSDGTFRWVKQIETNGGVIISGLDTNAAGEIFTSGIFLGTVDFDPKASEQSLLTSLSTTGAAISSGFAAKYSAEGNFIWTKHFRGTSATDFFMTLIRKDADDNLVISGSYKGSVRFSSTTTVTSNENYNAFLSKIDANGNLIWAKRIVSTDGFLESAFCANMTLDPCGNIYVSGEFTGTCDFDPSATVKELQSVTNTRAVYVAKYSTDGNHSWAFDIKGLGGPDFVEFNGYLPLTIDNNQNLLIAGSYRGTMDFDPSPAETYNLTSSNIPFSNIAGVFIAKYNNPNGCVLAVNDFHKEPYLIYPNPASDFVNIAFETVQKELSIELIDRQGRMILQQKNQSGNQFTVDTSALPKGIYLIKISTDTASYSQKLMVE